MILVLSCSHRHEGDDSRVAEKYDEAEADQHLCHEHRLVALPGLSFGVGQIPAAHGCGARGQGLGRRLVDDAATVAKGRGAARIFLEVRDGNDAAIGLYRSAGFLVVGRRPGYYAGMSGARFDAITMRRDLAPEL